MTKYTKRLADFFLVPYNPEENFLNDSGGAIQAIGQNDIVPYALVKDDLPLILPQRNDEGTSGVGEGKNETVVLESQFSPGAGSIPNTAIETIMIPRIGGDVTITHGGAEVWTVVAVTKANISHAEYFCFDVISAAGVTIKYQGWFNVDGGAAPSAVDCYDPVNTAAGAGDGINQTVAGKRNLVEFDIQADVTAQEVSDCITAAITALSDVSAANGGGTSETCTVTNGSNGSVQDAHDIDSSLVIAITTQGYSKAVIRFTSDDNENQNFGFHFQRDNGSYDTIYELTGVSIAEHTLEVEGEGEAVMHEDINYMVTGIKDTYGALTMLNKPRSAYGVAWTKNLSPSGNKFKNHGWHTVNENTTFTLNSVPLNLTWFGWKIFIENILKHNYDGGGKFAAGVDFNKRNCIITIDVQPEDHELYAASMLHWTDYGGAAGAGAGHEFLIQLKSITPGTSNQVYVQFDCDICRVEPFAQSIPADGSPERYSIDLKPAPGAVFEYTIQTYIPMYYFGRYN